MGEDANSMLTLLRGGRQAVRRTSQIASTMPLRTITRPLSTAEKPIFFDMKHSNNAARIRIWRELKGVQDKIERRVIGYADLKTIEFAKVNPLMKVPAFILEDGTTIFESQVILQYLEDAYGGEGPAFTPPTPRGKAHMNLLVRIHDLYIASPNCSQPGFSHTQGCMYLSNGWHGPARGMDVGTRAAKLKELWTQLGWLEEHIDAAPFMVGDQITLADMTWFPTFIFMEFLLPRVFGWDDILNKPDYFPNIHRWFTQMLQDPVMQATRADIWEYWVDMEEQGQFKPIIEETMNAPDYKWLYTETTDDYLRLRHPLKAREGSDCYQ